MPLTPEEFNKTPLSAKEAAKFLQIGLSTLYHHINEIPHCKQFGKLYFFRPDLLDYLNSKLPEEEREEVENA